MSFFVIVVVVCPQNQNCNMCNTQYVSKYSQSNTHRSPATFYKKIERSKRMVLFLAAILILRFLLLTLPFLPYLLHTHSSGRGRLSILFPFPFPFHISFLFLFFFFGNAEQTPDYLASRSAFFVSVLNKVLRGFHLFSRSDNGFAPPPPPSLHSLLHLQSLGVMIQECLTHTTTLTASSASDADR